MSQMCRTCLQEIRDSNFFSLTNNSSVAIIIKSQLALCIPEITPDLISEPVMCHKCVTTLHSSFEFKYKCLQSEERIRNFVQSHRMHEGTTGINLLEMFTNFYGEVCENGFANDVGIAEELQLTNNIDTVLDIKYETLSIDEDELNPGKICTDPLEDSFVEDTLEENVEEGNVVCQLPNKEHSTLCSPVCREICTLEKLCISEELQLHFNCIFIEQSSPAKTTHEGNEFPVISINSTDNLSCNLEYWNRFEERFLSGIYESEASQYMEDEREEENSPCCNVTSSYNSKQSRSNKKITRAFENSEKSILREPPVKRPRLIRAAKCKINKQTKPSNPEGVLKYKKVPHNKRKLVKPIKRRKSKRINKIFKCDQCKYTTKFQINLELHSVSHIEINENETQAESNVEQCSTTYYRKTASECSKGYKYIRYDYPKKQRLAADMRKYNKRKKYFKQDYSEQKLIKNAYKNIPVVVGNLELLINDCTKAAQCQSQENIQFDEGDQLSTVDKSQDQYLGSDHIEKHQSIVNESVEGNFPAEPHTKDNRKVQEQEGRAIDALRNDEIVESSLKRNETSNSTINEQILKVDNGKEGKGLKNNCFGEQFSRNNTVQVDDPNSNNQLDDDQYTKNDGSKNETGKNQASTIDLNADMWKNDKIDKNDAPRNEHSETNRSSDTNSIKISSIIKYNGGYVLRVTSKSHTADENEQHKNDNVNTDEFVCNDKIEDYVDAEIKRNQIEGNEPNTNTQSLGNDSAEKVQSVRNENEKITLNIIHDERKQFHNCETSTCFRNNNMERDNIENDYTEGNRSLQSDQLVDHSVETENDEIINNAAEPTEKRLKKNCTLKNHIENYIAKDEYDTIKQNNSFRSIKKDPIKCGLTDSELLKYPNDDPSNKNEYCKKSEYVNSTRTEDNLCICNDSTSETCSTKDMDNTFKNQCCSMSNDPYRIKPNQDFRSDHSDGKQFNYAEKQPFGNTGEKSQRSDYGKRFFSGDHIGEFFKNTKRKKKKIQIGQHIEKLLDVPTKRKLRSNHLHKKFFKSDGASEPLYNSGDTENAVSKCSEIGNFEFCDCSSDTFNNDVNDVINFSLEKRYSGEEKVDATQLVPKMKDTAN